MYYLDKKIENLHRIFDQNERSSFLRLDLNENPGGLPEDFIKDVMAKVTPRLVSQYPETLPFTEKLAEFLGTDISHLCLVTGLPKASATSFRRSQLRADASWVSCRHTLCFRYIRKCMAETS